MKGIFTQGACILMDRRVGLDEVLAALGPFAPGHRPATGTPWLFESGALTIPLPDESGGVVLVDTVPSPFPDGMGATEDAPLFSAWALGTFGPFAWPGALERALQHGPDKALVKATRRHQGFVRVLTSYSQGQEHSPLLPERYDALLELRCLTDVVTALLALPGALAVFFPGGESLRSPREARQVVEAHRQGGPLPLPLWCNTRRATLAPTPDWTLVDTVGMEQLDLPDFEACIPRAGRPLGDVEGLLLDMALYALRERRFFDTGHTLTDPGGRRWCARVLAQGLRAPPRPVFRWFLDDVAVPPALEAEPPMPAPDEELEPHYALWLKRQE